MMSRNQLFEFALRDSTTTNRERVLKLFQTSHSFAADAISGLAEPPKDALLLRLAVAQLGLQVFTRLARHVEIEEHLRCVVLELWAIEFVEAANNVVFEMRNPL